MNTVFVYEEVLTDFTDGLVVLVARDENHAIEMLCVEFERNYEQLMEFEPGFLEPTAMYPTTAEAGSLHICWGGA